MPLSKYSKSVMSFCAVTVTLNSFVIVTSPFFTVAVSVTFASLSPDAGLVTFPSFVITLSLLLDHVISLPALLPFDGSSKLPLVVSGTLIASTSVCASVFSPASFIVI